MLGLLQFIYVNHVKHFKASPRVVHPPEVLFQICFSSKNLSIFRKIQCIEFVKFKITVVMVHEVYNLNPSFFTSQ